MVIIKARFIFRYFKVALANLDIMLSLLVPSFHHSWINFLKHVFDVVQQKRAFLEFIILSSLFWMFVLLAYRNCKGFWDIDKKQMIIWKRVWALLPKVPLRDHQHCSAKLVYQVLLKSDLPVPLSEDIQTSRWMFGSSASPSERRCQTAIASPSDTTIILTTIDLWQWHKMIIRAKEMIRMTDRRTMTSHQSGRTSQNMIQYRPNQLTRSDGHHHPSSSLRLLQQGCRLHCLLWDLGKHQEYLCDRVINKPILTNYQTQHGDHLRHHHLQLPHLNYDIKILHWDLCGR